LFCFHGYGEQGNTFYLLEKGLGKDYTLIAPDFPFHGATQWKDGLLFTPEDLLEVLSLITKEPGKPFNLLGYSMGGRIALYLLQTVPDKIGQVVLIAPDGLHHNIWHTLSTRTWIGNHFFAFTMYHPFWLFTFIKLGYTTGLLNKSIFNFVHYYLDSKESRTLLYKRWTTMRKFNTDLPLLKKTIRRKKIPVTLLFGKFDRIIFTSQGISFQKELKDLVKITELEVGHQLLREKYAGYITALFYPDTRFTKEL
jgi:pimeloyl-ACP methyl ester carboxylesterase